MHRVRLINTCIQSRTGMQSCSDSVGKRTISVFQGKVSSGTQHKNKYVGQRSKTVASANSGLSSRRSSLLDLESCGACSSLFHTTRRAYSTSDEDGTDRKIQPVFFAIPNPIKVVKNKIFSWLIRSYFDQDFSLEEFTNGAKQALVIISQQVAEGTWENLEGLLAPKLLREMKERCQGLSLKEMTSFLMTEEDILHSFPHDMTIHYDDKGGKFLFILMKFWCHSLQSGSSDPEVKGFRIGKPPPGVSQEQFDSMGSVYSCTYEFLRNISPGASPEWTITFIQHGQLINTETRGLPDNEEQ